MGIVINFNAARQQQARPAEETKRCPRCGADLWRIHGNGKVCCADCEQACPLRSLVKSNT